MTFTIGADPEIFLRRKGEAVSAHGVIPGTKKEPHPVESGAIQVDGMAVEFNITPVSWSDFNTFNLNVVRVMDSLKKKVKESNPDYSFNLSPVQDFDPEYLESQPEEAKELGCDPDYSAYTLAHNPTPDAKVSFRTGSGHLHVGWGADIPVDNPEHIEICANAVKMFDATVGMLMTFIDREPRRRNLYGKAGAMRPKPYGVEYRTPSNVWLKSKRYREAVFYLLQNALSMLQRGRTADTLIAECTSNEFRRIIDEGDYKAAANVLDIYARRFFTVRHWEAIKKEFEEVK